MEKVELDGVVYELETNGTAAIVGGHRDVPMKNLRERYGDSGQTVAPHHLAILH
jgi:hypothetical protein